MKAIVRKNLRLAKRRRRVRGKVSGTSDRPRMTISKSLRHIYAQVIDDEKRITLASASSLCKEVLSEVSGKNKTEAAEAVGSKIAQISLDKGIKKIAFDRNGIRYHGRVKALADAARKAGLEF